MKKVLAETTLLDPHFQVLVGRRDHADVGLDRVVAADPIEMPVAQHAQQSRLEVERHVADFVEEERAALGLLEAAAAHGLRAGKCAALMAKEFAFEKILWNRRGVDCDEGPIGARRMLVQRTRDQFLARARFAGDQHGDIALREPSDRAEDVLHRRCLPEHLGRGRHALFGHFLALAFVDGAADELHRPRQVEGLRKVFEGAALKRRDGAIKVGEGGHDDDRQSRVLGLDLVEQIEAGTTRHADVAHQDLGALQFVVGSRFECGKDLARVGEATGRQVFAQQRFFQHEAD